MPTTTTTRACQCTGPDRIEWIDEPEPELAPEEVRIRSRYGAAKHGTEMAGYRGYAARRGRMREDGIFDYQPREVSYPLWPGNQFVGEVVEVGSAVTRYRVGDVVFGMGSFRERHVRPADQVHPLPDGVDWRSAMCWDPAIFALGAVRDGHVRLGDNVACFGCGAIGLMLVQCLRLAGARRVFALDPIARRREVADHLGADASFDPTQCDAGAELRAATGGRGVDVAIDFSGHRDAIQHALRGVAFGGTVVCGAFPPPMAAGLDLGAEAHLNIPQIVFTRACSQPDRDHPRWDIARVEQTCIDLLIGGQLTGVGIVDPVVTPEELPAAYRDIADHPERSVKLGVDFGVG